MLTTRASAAGLAALKSSISRSEDTREDSLLSLPHKRRCARRSGRMVMPKDVQRTVHDQSQHFFTDGNALTLRIVAGDLRTNVDVSDNGATFPQSPKPERDHVGRAAVAQV